ncbi:hypothetical protein [Erwinia sp.]|uniref:hypothetical protein n=1 Tax=Erwinia citreus TaxID=558 RepID=UPI0028999D53|nr:hypothetical protein [Erwinia sp.]
MKVNLAIVVLAFVPLLAVAKPKAPDCHSWPMNMTEGWLKNTGIVDIPDLDESKTEVTLLSSEKKEKDLYTQVYHFVFHNKNGKTYEVITKSDASSEECSMSGVNSYLISKSDINY